MQPYRVAAERLDEYTEAWIRLRRRRLLRRVVVAVVGYAFATAFVFALKSSSSPADGTINYTAILIGVLPAVAIGLLAAWRARNLAPFICPGCSEPFFRGLIMEIGFERNCANCGLAIGTQAPQTDDARNPEI